jgi:hypothetical protein
MGRREEGREAAIRCKGTGADATLQADIWITTLAAFCVIIGRLMSPGGNQRLPKRQHLSKIQRTLKTRCPPLHPIAYEHIAQQHNPNSFTGRTSMSRLTTNTGSIAVALLGAVSMPTSLAAQQVDFPTTCSTEADAEVDVGLTLLHNMMYIEAEAAFGRAAAADPDCAMAQWGVAMANFHPLWPGTPSEEETARGTAAAEHLASMTPGSDLEQAFAVAAVAFYAPDHENYRARLAAWAQAQQIAQEQH